LLLSAYLHDSYPGVCPDEERGNSLIGSGVITRGFGAGFELHKMFGLIFAFLLFSLVCTFTGLKAEYANTDEMNRVCRNWLTKYVFNWGGWAETMNPSILSSIEIMAGDTLLAVCYNISPSGFVIVPTLKELPPIKAYSEEAVLDERQSQGFIRLLRDELRSRNESLRAECGTRLSDSFYRDRWEHLSLSESEFEEYLISSGKHTMEQAGPLLTASWHQNLPYKRLCPEGDGGLCLVGCVATAMAQILKFWQWPINGVGGHTYFWDGDQSCGGESEDRELSVDFVNTYGWSNMLDSCDYGCDPMDSAALAELNYEVAAAMETDFGLCGSSANANTALSAYSDHFMYSSSITLEVRSSYSLQDWFTLIQTEINAGRPIHYFISGHSLVCDGWRIQGEQYEYHMNYGWGGQFTSWYVLDSVIPSPAGYDKLKANDYMFINIQPETEPDLEFVCFALNDSLGDGDGYAEVGEIFEISLDIANHRYHAFNVQATISCDDAFISILSHEALFGDSIYWGEIKTSQTSFCIHARYPCPDPYIATIQLVVSALGGYAITDSFYLFIGSQTSFEDDMEAGGGYWTIPEPGPDSVNEWHLETFRAYSGSSSWKAGGIGQTDYANHSHSRLISPPFLLPPEAGFGFWHWIDAEPGFVGGSALDGGNVLISSNCEEWTLLIPQGGYTHSATGVPCFSGNYDWSKAQFDLSQYSGVVRIMFNFFSDSRGTREGWYIDDMAVYSTIPCGDANRDGVINVSDVIFLINYIFIPECPEPEPFCAGDTNADGSVNITDVVAIINFIYALGDPPSSGCCN
jgi:hypothetical protein